ncbi:cytochrome c6, chloroplastic isoform X2 [Ricinus communis]|uniref:cytochrome c6, chloroplastic isoform X2 n=1 Tax=Ricinus communis TaxID=3988 RepID=UPI00201A88FD|nr:cytochrome c6, chloroplastic isoform X2 [Ricinus communis]
MYINGNTSLTVHKILLILSLIICLFVGLPHISHYTHHIEMGILSVIPACGNSACTSLLSMGNKKEGEVKKKAVVAVAVKLKEAVNKLIMKSTGIALSPLTAAAFLALSPLSYTPVSLAQTTADIQKGATLFSRSCIGCHDAGGNLIQPGATLFMKDLQRNGVDSEEEIYKITYFGKGRMPGFGQNCTPRGQCTFGPRLQDEEIKLLAEFVKSQADQGWPTIETIQD